MSSHCRDQLDVKINEVAITAEILDRVNVQTEIITEPIIKSEIQKNSEILTRIETAPSVAINLTSGGTRGYSAYEVWLQQGNTGSVSDYIESLRGPGAQSYVHEQILASNTWLVVHRLHKFPSVTIVDSGENVVIGDIDYVDEETVALRFTAAFGGKAYLN